MLKMKLWEVCKDPTVDLWYFKTPVGTKVFTTEFSARLHRDVFFDGVVAELKEVVE